MKRVPRSLALAVVAEDLLEAGVVAVVMAAVSAIAGNFQSCMCVGAAIVEVAAIFLASRTDQLSGGML